MGGRDVRWHSRPSSASYSAIHSVPDRLVMLACFAVGPIVVLVLNRRRRVNDRHCQCTAKKSALMVREMDQTRLKSQASMRGPYHKARCYFRAAVPLAHRLHPLRTREDPIGDDDSECVVTVMIITTSRGRVDGSMARHGTFQAGDGAPGSVSHARR
jgi:hypothetical protein